MLLDLLPLLRRVEAAVAGQPDSAGATLTGPERSGGHLLVFALAAITAGPEKSGEHDPLGAGVSHGVLEGAGSATSLGTSGGIVGP